MKTLITALFAAFLMLAPTGCVTTPAPTNITAEGRTYITFKDIWVVTHTAYSVYCDRVALGKVTAADQADIDKAWNAFRGAFKISIAAAQMDATQWTPDNVRKLSNDVLVLIG